MKITVTNSSQNLWTQLLSDAQRAVINNIVASNGNINILLINNSTTNTDVVYVENGADASVANGTPIKFEKSVTLFSTNLSTINLIGNVASIDVRVLVAQG